MLSHPLTTGALFLLVGMLYERRHTREISDYRRHLEARARAHRTLRRRDVRRHRPARLLRASSASSSRSLGAFIDDRRCAVVATIGVILAAVYMLWMFQRVFTGGPEGQNAKINDMTVRELCVVAPLARTLALHRHLPEAGARPDRAAAQQVIANFERKTDYRSPEQRRSSCAGSGRSRVRRARSATTRSESPSRSRRTRKVTSDRRDPAHHHARGRPVRASRRSWRSSARGSA